MPGLRPWKLFPHASPNEGRPPSAPHPSPDEGKMGGPRARIQKAHHRGQEVSTKATGTTSLSPQCVCSRDLPACGLDDVDTLKQVPRLNRDELKAETSVGFLVDRFKPNRLLEADAARRG